MVDNMPGMGDRVRYVDESEILFDANVQCAFTDGPVNLRIIGTDYDIYRIAHDTNKTPKTWEAS